MENLEVTRRDLPQRHEGTKFHEWVSRKARKEAKARKCCFNFPLGGTEGAWGCLPAGRQGGEVFYYIRK